tara:strand:+ start:2132 stop:2965 length:834 start_codon:yes stop_codon:yes gene_type:complete
MGFNPFKSIKKIVKKIGKGIKKIGKGLKKVMGKIMKPFAKLGIVGQIGLGMLMPWAIGSIFSGLTSTAFANFAGNLVSNGNLFGKMAGRLMQGVHWGATKIKGAYSSVTEAISGGFETVTNKAKEMFGIDADASNILTQDTTTVPSVTEEVIKEEVKEEVVDKTFGEQLLTKTKEAVLDVPTQLAGSALSGVQEGIAMSIAQPEIPFNNQVADFLSLDARSAYTKYNEIDFTQLNNYNNELVSQGGLYAGPAHAVQVGVDNSFGMNDFDAFLFGGRQ